MVRFWFRLYRAIADGIPLMSYLHWTFIDNYEWNHGLSGYRFGLYGYDASDPSKTRVPRRTVDVFRRVSEQNIVPRDLLEKNLSDEEKTFLQDML